MPQSRWIWYLGDLGKYSAWESLFEDREDSVLSYSIAQLAEMIPGGLPRSAYDYQAWWFGHSQNVWERFGWRASPSLGTKTVQFCRVGQAVRSEGDRRRARGHVSTPDIPTGPRFVLLGCVKTKVGHTARAKDLYESPLWAKRRRYAEQSGMPWAILSAEHGLVDPEEILAPYDRYLGNKSGGFRRAWSDRAATALLPRLRASGVAVVEIHAGSAYVEGGLSQRLRGEVVDVYWPVRGMSIGQQLAWYR